MQEGAATCTKGKGGFRVISGLCGFPFPSVSVSDLFGFIAIR